MITSIFNTKYYFDDVYEPAYDVIYDWEAIIFEDELLEDLHEEEEEEEQDFEAELWLPGSEEVGEA